MKRERNIRMHGIEKKTISNVVLKELIEKGHEKKHFFLWHMFLYMVLKEI